jgi:hypothetical protein
MDQSTSWKADSSAASPEIPRILQNPKVHYRDHKSPQLVPINPVYVLPSYLFHFNIILSSNPRVVASSFIIIQWYSTLYNYAVKTTSLNNLRNKLIPSCELLLLIRIQRRSAHTHNAAMCSWYSIII